MNYTTRPVEVIEQEATIKIGQTVVATLAEDAHIYAGYEIGDVRGLNSIKAITTMAMRTRHRKLIGEIDMASIDNVLNEYNENSNTIPFLTINPSGGNTIPCRNAKIIHLRSGQIKFTYETF